MVDRDLIISKAGLVKKHTDRVEKKRGDDLNTFLGDQDLQDIISFNLHTAIQNCIDFERIFSRNFQQTGNFRIEKKSSLIFLLLQIMSKVEKLDRTNRI